MNAAGEKTVRDLLAKGRSAQFVADASGWPYAQVVAMAEKMRAEAAAAETADPPPADLAAMREAAREVVEPRPEVKARIASATELLVRADGVEDRKVQSALSRARKAMTDLASAMADYTDRSEARATVERLEQELRDAKAALRRRPSAAAKVTAPAPRQRATASGERPCAKGCGRILVPQGRYRHEATCTGAAKVAS